MSLVKREYWLAGVVFFPSSTPTATLQHSRHFQARLFPRRFLAQPEISRVQTKTTRHFKISATLVKQPMLRLTSSTSWTHVWLATLDILTNISAVAIVLSHRWSYIQVLSKYFGHLGMAPKIMYEVILPRS